MQDLQDYCRPFYRLSCFRQTPLSCSGVVGCLPHQTQLARLSDRYQRLVLRGESPKPKDIEVAPRLQDPKGFSITIATHPCGAKPVLSVSHHDDFVLIMRCLAHRCERIPVQGSMHAQAVAGLIH